MSATKLKAPFGLRDRHCLHYDKIKSQGELALYYYTSSYSCGFLNCNTGYDDNVIWISFRGPEDISQMMQGLIEAIAGQHFSFFGEDGGLIEIWSNNNELNASYHTSSRGKYWCDSSGVHNCCPINIRGSGRGHGQLTKWEAGRLFHILMALLRNFADYQETVIRFQDADVG